MQKTSETVEEGAVPSFSEALRVWAKIGVISFGGPAGQIALMHRVLVDEKKWIDEPRYLNALNFCMLLPGPEATQLATYVGWRMHGVKGGLAAGLLFVLPGSLVILILSILYAAIGKLPPAEALLTGVKAAVLAIVIEALIRISRRGLRTAADQILAGLAFVAIFFLAVPFPLIVLTAAVWGFLRAKPLSAAPAAIAPPVPIPAATTLLTALFWLAVWLGPLLALATVLGPGHVLAQIGWFFSKLAVVTFGGAYAVLAYMAQDVVQYYGWLTPGEMVDGLGLAETTPGPLILVTEFVGFLAAHRHGGGNPWLMGTLGAVVTLWATFAPCFLWIFVGAPYIERLHSAPRLKSALAAVTAAVVGVVLNLTVWFALNVLFTQVSRASVGPVRLLVPAPESLSVAALGLSMLAAALLFVFHRGVVTTLAVCAAAAFLLHLLVG